MYTYGITGSSINEFQDTTITSVADDQVLQYNSSNGQWENKAAKTVVLENEDAHAERQAPANGRFHGPMNVLPIALASPVYLGGVVKIIFSANCTVTDVGVCLSTAYTGATTRDYRLALYQDDGTGDFPGALVQDLGVVSIANGAAAGMKTVALTTPLAVTAGTVLWGAVNVVLAGSGFPAVSYVTGMVNPYADYGIGSTGQTAAVAFSQNGGSTTAFANPYVLQAVPTTGVCVTPYLKVTVP